MDEKCLFLRCSHYLVMLLFGVTSVYAQQQSDSIRKRTATEIFLSQPNFSAYKDNYFITGVSLRDKLSKETSDIKYQISFKYLLSRKPLFDNVYSFITYTQKSFWKVYEKSSPFEDINFNPTIGVIRPYTDRKNRIGYYSLMFEHESNGRESLQSRSWNFLSFNWQGQISNKVVLRTRILIPFVSGDNPDLVEYEGFVEAGLSYTFIPKKLYMEFLIQKGSKLDWKGALQTQVVYRPFKSSNQYIFLQWYHGYAEGLLDYRKETSMLRLGIIIKPTFMNFY